MSPRTASLIRRGGPAIVALSAVALVAYKLVAQIAVGPRWDSYSFVANAAQFAGRGIGYTEPARPPLISLIAALPLALGAFDVRVIQVIDALLALGSLVGFYVLFRLRLGRNISALAVLALLVSPVIWEWLGVGYTDFAAMGLCAWSLYFLVRAADEDPRLYAVAFPLFLGASLMRFTSLLFAVPMVVWLLLRARPWRQVKPLAMGVAVTALCYAPFAVYYQRVVGDPLYPYIASTHVQEAGSAAGVVQQLGSFATASYWLAAPRPIAALVLLVFAMAAVGLATAAWRFVREGRRGVGRVILGLVVGAAFAWAARHGGFAASQLSVALGVFAVWRILTAEDEVSRPGTLRRVPGRLALDAAMLAWTLAFFCFHDSWAQRVTRYYITMAPGVVYFVALGWKQLVRQAAEMAAAGSPAATGKLRVALTVPVVVVIAAGLALNVAGTSWSRDPAVTGAQETATWLASRSPDPDTVVYSDLWPMTSWYLGRGVRAMPLFDDPRAVDHELAVSRAAFYVTTKSGRFRDFRTQYETPAGRVLERTATSASLPEMLYLGSGWENYLEQLDDYGLHLVHHEGEYDMEGTAFLDAYAPREMAQYSAIAAFGFQWHDRSGSERALDDWVASGGTLVIDASHNLQQPTSLDGSVLFDTVIRRASLPRTTAIDVQPGFAATHPEIGHVDASPFADESGEPWYGATYAAMPGSAPLKVLASAGGHPLIIERQWGRGRVYWIAYNLAWHAHVTDNAGEARLISAVLEEALRTRHLAEGPTTRLAGRNGASRR